MGTLVCSVLLIFSYLDWWYHVKTGVEARGFIFGPPIALAIGAKFVPLRKPKKLPGLHSVINVFSSVVIVIAVPLLLRSRWMKLLTLFHLSDRRGDLRRVFFGIWN
jgi:hypothetical protein